MPAPKLSTLKPSPRALLALGSIGGTIALVLALAGPSRMLDMARAAKPHTPDFSILAAAPMAIQLHVAAAMTALGIGVVLLAGVKGTRLHKALGWTWVAAMAITALSSFAIHQINPAGFSWIHAISGWTVISLPMAVWAIKRGKVKTHARSMTGMFVGGLLIAGTLSFLPGRMMWRVLFG